MNIKKGDKVMLKKNGVMGRAGDIWVVENVDSEYIDVSYGRFRYVTVSINSFDRYFDVKEEEPEMNQTIFNNPIEFNNDAKVKPADDCCCMFPNKVSKEKIDKILDQSEISVRTIYNKCTLVSCKLPNGFVINESSACVDPVNYNEEIGYNICMQRIKDKIWELEGYLLAEKLNSNNDYYYDEDDCVDDCRYCANYNDCCFR